MTWLCEEITKIFLNQPVYLYLETQVNACGDIHGQYLNRLFEAGGYPTDVNYLFLGDYVDRGEQSIETICLLFYFKIKCSNNFFLLAFLDLIKVINLNILWFKFPFFMFQNVKG